MLLKLTMTASDNPLIVHDNAVQPHITSFAYLKSTRDEILELFVDGENNLLRRVGDLAARRAVGDPVRVGRRVCSILLFSSFIAPCATQHPNGVEAPELRSSKNLVTPALSSSLAPW